MQRISKFKANNKILRELLLLVLLIIIVSAIVITVRNFWLAHKSETNAVRAKLAELEHKVAGVHDHINLNTTSQEANSNNFTNAQIKDAYMLTRTAANLLQNEQDLATAKQLLQLAAEHLATVHMPKVQQAQEILAADQAKLAAVKLPDPTVLQDKLAILDKLVYILPAHKNTQIPEINKDKGLQVASTTPATWYQPLLNFVANIKAVVKIRKKAEHEISTVEVEIAREQLKLLIAQLRWAGVYRSPEIYQRSIGMAQTLLTEIFDTSSESVQKCAQILQELATIQLQLDLPNIQNSVDALHAILIG